MNFHLRIWRQTNPTDAGSFKDYEAKDIPAEASFLEMLDIVNEGLMKNGEEPVAFDSDCREGICGTCSLTINGIPHGPGRGTTCQLYMRKFRDGEAITIEPFRVGSFPLLRDLVTDRCAFDRVIASGGFITERSGSAPDANAMPISKPIADEAMDAAACIGCGACAAACPNSSAMLFVSAKVGHLGLLPQGQAEKNRRVLSMVRQMDNEGFGNCSNYYECEAVCPASIPAAFIARMNREYTVAALKENSGVTG
ncbi:MAG: succinate dehydrogenase/fumarate reductase iron-sulfur subunit [Chthoniobacterales bacterium]